ncbi:MAG: hypothetical protein SRB1_01996 [Desulfobacteraceae bacterium Eth-SRB1]|nr:MAG: hypothetical protein SRB1_01996 [Desulfobacteraceae bacterium Eth-SRB1]
MAKSKHTLKQKRKFWQAHITSWEKTDISQAEYCRLNGLSSRSFGYWKKRQDSAKVNPVSFVPVPLAPPMDVGSKVGRAPLCIVLDDRYRIEVSDDFYPLTLQRLVHALEQK